MLSISQFFFPQSGIFEVTLSLKVLVEHFIVDGFIFLGDLERLVNSLTLENSEFRSSSLTGKFQMVESEENSLQISLVEDHFKHLIPQIQLLVGRA